MAREMGKIEAEFDRGDDSTFDGDGDGDGNGNGSVGGFPETRVEERRDGERWQARRRGTRDGTQALVEAGRKPD